MRGTNTAVGWMAPYRSGMLCPVSGWPPNISRAPADADCTTRGLRRRCTGRPWFACLAGRLSSESQPRLQKDKRQQSQPCGGPTKSFNQPCGTPFDASIPAQPPPLPTRYLQQPLLVLHHALRRDRQHRAHREVLQPALPRALRQRLFQAYKAGGCAPAPQFPRSKGSRGGGADGGWWWGCCGGGRGGCCCRGSLMGGAGRRQARAPTPAASRTCLRPVVVHEQDGLGAALLSAACIRILVALQPGAAGRRAGGLHAQHARCAATLPPAGCTCVLITRQPQRGPAVKWKPGGRARLEWQWA